MDFKVILLFSNRWLIRNYVCLYLQGSSYSLEDSVAIWLGYIRIASTQFYGGDFR